MYCYQQNSQEATKWKSQVEKCSQFSHYVDYAIKHTKQFMCFHYFVFLLLKKKKNEEDVEETPNLFRAFLKWRERKMGIQKWQESASKDSQKESF